MWASQSQVRYEYEKGQFLSLGAKKNDGLIVCQGRFSEDRLLEILGIPYLPILHPSSALSKLVMTHAHKSDHRKGAQSVLAGSRRWAWILRGRKAADLAIKACMSCRLRSSLQVQQLMGDVPKHYLKTAAPFSVVAIDLFGPIVVKGVVNS